MMNMVLKSVDLIHPVKFRSAVDMSLIADEAHGDTLELIDGAVRLISHISGLAFVPLTNVKRLVPYAEGELEAIKARDAAAAERVKIIPKSQRSPVPTPAQAKSDVISYTKDASGQIIEVRGQPAVAPPVDPLSLVAAASMTQVDGQQDDE